MIVFCDNEDCCHIDEFGCCDADKLNIEGGICKGTLKCGRNVCEGDVDERLKAENARLRELVRDYERCTMHADCSKCEYDGKLSEHCPLSPCFPDADELCELGVEVDGCSE